MSFSSRLAAAFLACCCLLGTSRAQAQSYVCIETNIGEFCMQLLAEVAPRTVENFLKYVQDGDFNNTFFHRSVPSFIVQGGGYKLDPLGEEVPEDPQIENEFGTSNTRGTVAMAKFSNQPDSASSQWFVNLTDNSATLDFTNGGFTVFARVVRGMAVVDAIGNSLRVNLASSLGDSFTEVPVLRRDEDGVGLEDLVQIVRAYTAEDVEHETQTPEEEENEDEELYQCTADWVAQQPQTEVCMDTNMGTFCAELYPDAAPNTVANFLHYVADGDYNGSFFHRSVPGFVVQGGGFKLEPLWFSVPSDPPIANEFSLSNTRGTLAMAKQAGLPDSATNQWFVNLADNTGLDSDNGGFTVFGKVKEADMAVIDAIAALDVFNLSELSGNLGEVPLIRSGTPEGLSLADFVKVNRAYIPGAGTNPCLPVKPEALTEFSSQSFRLPVRIGDVIYELTFIREFTTANYVFFVDLFRIRALADIGQETAVYTPATGMLEIPSMLVDGSYVIRDVKLHLTNQATLQFTLDSYSTE